MPLAQDIYETLIKDPDLEIGANQTREEAAQVEADFRTRQHINNIRALSLATEPLKKKSPIQALLNHVSLISKTIVSGSISIAQNILKETVSAALASDKVATTGINWFKQRNSKHWDIFTEKDKQFLQAFVDTNPSPAARIYMSALFAKRYTSNPKGGVGDIIVKMFDNPNPHAKQVLGGLGLTKTQTSSYGGVLSPAGSLSTKGTQFKNALSAITDDKGNSVFDIPFVHFKPESREEGTKNGVDYGTLTPEKTNVHATLESVNAALASVNSPYSLVKGGGSPGKIKLAHADGKDLDTRKLYNPFPAKTHGRLYQSMASFKAPEAGDMESGHFTEATISDFSIADMLNAVHWLSNKPTPEKIEEHDSALETQQTEVAAAKESEQKELKENPPPIANQAGATPTTAKKAGQVAKNLPHVMFGAWGHPQHGVSFKAVHAPYHMAHTMGMMYGICNHLGQVNKIGQALLKSAYENGALKKGHVYQAGNHAVVMIDGVQALMDFHGIDPINGATLAKEIASDIAGQKLGLEDMPEDIDWYDLADKIANKDFPNIEDTPQTLIDDTAEKLDVSPTPEPVGDATEAHTAMIAAAAKRLQAAHDSGDEDTIVKHTGKLALTIEEAKLAEMDEENPTNFSGIYGNEEIVDAIKDNINEEHHAATFKGLGESPWSNASAVGDNALGDIEEAAEPELPSGVTQADEEGWKNKLGELAEHYAQSEGAEKEFALEGLHKFMKTAGLNAPLTNQEINAAVSSKLGADTSQVNFLEGGFPGTPAETPVDPLAAPTPADSLKYAAEKFYNAHEHDYTGEGLSDAEIQQKKDLASENLKAVINEVDLPPGTAAMTAKMALTDLHDGDIDEVDDWLAEKGLQDVVSPEPPEQQQEVMPDALTNAIESWANIKAEQPDSAAQEAAADKLTEEINNAKDAGIDVDSIYNHLVDMGGAENAQTYSDSWPEGENPLAEDDATPSPAEEPSAEEIEPEEAPEEPEEAPVEPEEALPVAKPQPTAASPEKIAAKKEKVMALLFGDDMDSEEAQIYSDHLDENPSEVESAYKQHVIADIVNKQKQKVKDAAKAEIDKEKEEKKAAADAVKAEAKATADKEKEEKKENQAAANTLPSEPGDLDAIMADSEEEDATVGEGMATQHAAELMAHHKKYEDIMSPATKKKLVAALQNAAKHGADFAALKEEQEKMGDDFGSPEHLEEMQQKTAKKAEFAENHKNLTNHESTDGSTLNTQYEAFEAGKHDAFTDFDEEGKPVIGEKLPDEKETPAVKHNLLHSLTPIQRAHVDNMKKAKASGDSEGYDKAVKALEDSGIPREDIEHSGENAPKHGPPDPEVAKRKMAEGYVWHEETRSWILKATLQELKTGGGSNLVNASHTGARVDIPSAKKPFAVNEDETSSTKNYMHNEHGLFGVGDGTPPVGGAASHGHINQNVLQGKLSADGHLDTHAKAQNGITKLPQAYGHPRDKATLSAKPPKPKGVIAGIKGFKAAFLDAFNEGKAGAMTKGYPLDSATALAAFLKEYSIHSHLQNKHTIQELLDELKEPADESEEEVMEKSTLDGIMR